MVATRDVENGSTTIFAVNRSASDTALLDVRIVHDDAYTVVEHAVIGGAHLSAVNAQSDPARVTPLRSTAHELTDRGITAQLPPASWTMLRLAARSGR
jgi:alpha-N-arabinofuranosidase